LKRFDWIMGTVVIILALAVAAAALLPARFLTRPPQVVYLSPSKGPELWRADLEGGQPQQLTDTGGKLFDFTVAPDGRAILYSATNEQGGVDLWELSRGSGEARLLFPCGADWCINPAVSPDGKRLAFSRRRANITPGGSPGLPRVWLMERSSGAMQELYNNPQVTGYEPSWSPDGKKLAFFDGAAGGIRIFNLLSGEEQLVASNLGAVGAWSPDGTALLFIDAPSGETQPTARVYRLDVAGGEVQEAFSLDLEAVDFGLPDWSVDGWLAVGVQLLEGGSGRAIWIMRPDGSQARMVTEDETVHYGAYRWSPDGQLLVFQQLRLGGSDSAPQVAVWEMKTGEVKVIAEDASRPQWGR
jgi:TolB protein